MDVTGRGISGRRHRVEGGHRYPHFCVSTILDQASYSCDPEGGFVGEDQLGTATYRVGNRHRRKQVEARVVGDTVETSQNRTLLRVHPVKHDPINAHRAFANPLGKLHRINAAANTESGSPGVR